MFAVLVHFIDAQWEYHARLAICKGLADNPHTGEVISDITKKGLLDIGLGDADTLVQDCIHSCTLDEGSNMLKGWKGFEGEGCVCHRQQNCLAASLELQDIKPIITNIKGICAHFHRTHTVIYIAFPISFNIFSLTIFMILCRASTIYAH